jgi:uncharacterized protein (DUF488 family)
MANPIFTIGHSTRSLDEFIELLRGSGVSEVVDVRSIPRSRTNPQFNRDTLPEALAWRQIGYDHVAELGGRRAKQRSVEASLNAYWRLPSFHNYADYALTAPFAAGLARLQAAARRRRCAIMCSETLWWRCHRRIIADYLIAAGDAVLHILGPSQVEAARMTPGAVVAEDGTVTYPAAGSGEPGPPA